MVNKLTSKQILLFLIKYYIEKKFIMKPGHIVHVFLRPSKPTTKLTALSCHVQIAEIEC